MNVLYLRVPADLYAEFVAYAEHNGLSLNSAGLDALRLWIQMDPATVAR